MTRREMIALTTAGAFLDRAAPAAQPGTLRRMGIAPTACVLRSRGGAFDMVEHCHSLGMGGVQTRLTSFDPETVKAFRQRLDSYQMRAILSAPIPMDEGGVSRFDSAVKACKEAGAYALHAAMTGRRYEDFTTFDAFHQKFEQCKRSIALAEPILRKHKIPLAIENHKGWRAAEQAAWLKQLGSEWVGVCFDAGNNISLCEDPSETLRLLAPMAIFCHLKDMGVDGYPDGFLLSEVVFGEGIINLRRTVETLQAKDPDLLFCLEMITRDPLQVPVFTTKYWTTFDDSYSPLPGRDLARVLEIVRTNPPKKPLPHISGMAPEAQVKFEDENNARCIAYAREHLPLA